MGNKRQQKALLYLLFTEKPQGHQCPVDIQKQKISEVIHKKEVQKHGHCDQNRHEDRQIFFMYPAGRQRTMGKKPAVQLIILKIVRNP